jgi:hypothetical protein
VAGVGIALAVGSKGTLFYLLPGAACWAAWLLWRERARWRALGPTVAGLLVGIVILVAPGWARNLATYGSAFGPRDAVVLHHGSADSVSAYVEKLSLNLATSAVQAFEPTAQPFWLQPASRAVGDRLTRRFSADADPYVFIGQSRRDQLERVMKLTEPDADVVTIGLLNLALGAFGVLMAALAYRRPGAAQILVWAAGIAVYLVTQHALVQWHHWAFRFTVLAAPWLAVVGAWGVAQLPTRGQLVAWTILLLSAADVFASVQLRANQAAWQAWTRPERAFSHYTYTHWRDWAAALDESTRPLRVALPIDRPLAAFFRNADPRQVELVSLSALAAPTAEAAAGDAWLVVPLEQFMGREGRVQGRTNPAFGLAAYRALRPGEAPRPLVYRQTTTDAAGRRRWDWVVRRWPEAPVRLELFNPGVAPCTVEVRAPLGTRTVTVPAGDRAEVEALVPADVLAGVTLEFAPPVDASGQLTNLRVRFAP